MRYKQKFQYTLYYGYIVEKRVRVVTLCYIALTSIVFYTLYMISRFYFVLVCWYLCLELPSGKSYS